METKISAHNSTDIVLEKNQLFSGKIDNISKYNYLVIIINSDQSSIDTGVNLDFTNDKKHWVCEKFSYNKDDEKITKTFPIKWKYFKISYINGNEKQSFFKLQIIFQSIKDNKIEFADYNLDSAKRLRVSNPYSLLDIKHTKDKNPLLICEKTIGNGNVIYNYNGSYLDLTVKSTGDKVIRQTRSYITYQPGKSLMIKMTGILNANANGNNSISRIGYFDNENGIFFEYCDGLFNIVLRSNVSDKIIEHRIPQFEWDNNSNIFDFTKCQIFIIDFEWLGVGNIRCGCNYGDKIVYLHTINNTNSLYAPFMGKPNLPIRYEIMSMGDPATLRQICCSAASEAGYVYSGTIFSISNRVSPVTVSGFEVPVMTIRLKKGTRTLVNPLSYQIMTDENTCLHYSIYLINSPDKSPIIGTKFIEVNSNSVVEYAKGGIFQVKTGLFYSNNAIRIYEGYITGNTRYFSELTELSTNFRLTADIDGNSDYIVISCQAVKGVAKNAFVSLRWMEII